MKVLVLGATGYVGGRLTARLAGQGHRVRCLVRDPGRAATLAALPGVEIVQGDALDGASVRAAMERRGSGTDVVFHLVHSMTRGDFVDTDRTVAENVVEAAAAGRVGRLVYLGGLRPADDQGSPGELSRHLASRAEVGDVFLDGPVPAAVLQASLIIGSGSTSFEMLRFLAERLPVLPGMSWLDNPTQPIAIADVLHYLEAAATADPALNQTVDIGGPDVLTYRRLVDRYARIVRQPGPIWLPAPPLWPGLSALAVAGLTPVSAALAAPLLESLAHPMVCAPGEPEAALPEPPGGRLDVEESMRRALVAGPRESARRAEPVAVARPATPDPALPAPHDPPGSGGPAFVSEQRVTTDAGPEQVWQVIQSIGGDNGWYSLPYVWRLRGAVDRIIGGVGDYRGRRDPEALRPGEVLDWWRVEAVEPGRRLLLRAEMRMPGTAWLELSVGSDAAGETEYRQKVTFRPSGPAGHLYWWSQRLAHEVVFGVMARRLVRAAAKRDSIVVGEPVSA